MSDSTKNLLGDLIGGADIHWCPQAPQILFIGSLDAILNYPLFKIYLSACSGTELPGVAVDCFAG